ncbi:class I SAM-dependent methyltransferase [Deinococcus altitudinis]|uniref:class I SAM-dependent methyltransferase n=1 Tax=Deinococcus altitudinis TaxID=468914 RepID=UPI00389164F0
MKRTEYTEANRLAWNEAARVHAAQNFAHLLEKFSVPGSSVLHKPHELERLGPLAFHGQAVAQVCCNNGRELISIRNLGAGRCVGFDISDEFIVQARELNAAAHQDCEFVRSDAYAIPEKYRGNFGLVYLTVGALGWMPDLPSFIQVLVGLLQPGGALLIYEMHPFLDMLDPINQADPANPLELRHSYFKPDPFVDTGGLDYYSHQEYKSRPQYWFHHKLSDILGAVLGAGLVLKAFDEYPHDISAVFEHLETLPVKGPMCYILEAHLPG